MLGKSGIRNKSSRIEGQPTLFLINFLGVENCIKLRKCLEKQEKVVKDGLSLIFSWKSSVHFRFSVFSHLFLLFYAFSCFSTPKKKICKKRVGCPSSRIFSLSNSCNDKYFSRNDVELSFQFMLILKEFKLNFFVNASIEMHPIFCWHA